MREKYCLASVWAGAGARQLCELTIQGATGSRVDGGESLKDVREERFRDIWLHRTSKGYRRVHSLSAFLETVRS